MTDFQDLGLRSKSAGCLPLPIRSVMRRSRRRCASTFTFGLAFAAVVIPDFDITFEVVFLRAAACVSIIVYMSRSILSTSSLAIVGAGMGGTVAVAEAEAVRDVFDGGMDLLGR
ncbi:hypothetical protein H4582DRAFT_2098452 [Lactarius indigo]|nr:hypothetical protein H4582DRAFT_2098452 [Lactarius indigo]